MSRRSSREYIATFSSSDFSLLDPSSSAFLAGLLASSTTDSVGPAPAKTARRAAVRAGSTKPNVLVVIRHLRPPMTQVWGVSTGLVPSRGRGRMMTSLGVGDEVFGEEEDAGASSPGAAAKPKSAAWARWAGDSSPSPALRQGASWWLVEARALFAEEEEEEEGGGVRKGDSRRPWQRAWLGAGRNRPWTRPPYGKMPRALSSRQVGTSRHSSRR